jgi:hypothetical protein
MVNPSLPDEGRRRRMGRGGFEPFEISTWRTIPIDKKIKIPSLRLSPRSFLTGRE